MGAFPCTDLHGPPYSRLAGPQTTKERRTDKGYNKRPKKKAPHPNLMASAGLSSTAYEAPPTFGHFMGRDARILP